MKIIGFILIICALAGIAHGGLNSGAILGLFIGIGLVIPEYLLEFKGLRIKIVN